MNGRKLLFRNDLRTLLYIRKIDPEQLYLVEMQASQP